jgi:hypothetical protein
MAWGLWAVPIFTSIGPRKFDVHPAIGASRLVYGDQAHLVGAGKQWLGSIINLKNAKRRPIM